MHRTREKLALSLLIIVGMLLVLLWIFESQVQTSLVGTVLPLSLFHGYMIGLVFPESLYIKALWNTKTARAHNPLTGKFITYALFGFIGALIAIGGFLIVTGHIIPFFETSFSNLVHDSYFTMIVYGAWLFISIPLLAIVLFAIASPPGLLKTLKSIHRHLRLT